MANCKDCGTEFEKASNRRAVCLECRRKHDKEWRAARKAAGNPARTPKMPREWHRAYEAEYTQRQEVKAKKAEAARIRMLDPIERPKHVARWKARRAIAAGRLKKLPCWECGAPDVQAHHADYSRPLDVVWLCVKHHSELHAKAKAGAA